jgi:hypothetical protein
MCEPAAARRLAWDAGAAAAAAAQAAAARAAAAGTEPGAPLFLCLIEEVVEKPQGCRNGLNCTHMLVR